MSNLRLLCKIPTRERSIQFFQVLRKAQVLRSLPQTRFMITLDSNDPSMNNEASKKILKMWGNLTFHYGESKSKIDAVNRDMDKAGEWDVILLLSDDMVPRVKGYDRIICETMEKHFPDTDGVIWINDGYTQRKINTIVCMGRKYYERFNYIYHPAYKSLFSDNEYTDEFKRLGKFVYLEQPLIEHRHPMNVKGVIMDALYRRNDSHYMTDRKLYYYRRDHVLA